MWNIIIGIIFVIGGLTGELALIGTNSSTAITVVGAAMIVWGLVQVVRGRQEE